MTVPTSNSDGKIVFTPTFWLAAGGSVKVPHAVRSIGTPGLAIGLVQVVCNDVAAVIIRILLQMIHIFLVCSS
jgi:hypothetical protein